MRVTQGCFSFLPDLTDEQITAQIQYCLEKGWAVNIEFTDDPHPRNTYWDMWGLPMFDLRDAAGIMMELSECRKVYGDRYIRMSGFDSSHGWESVQVVLHRQPSEGGAGLPPRTAGIRRPQHPLHHEVLCRRSSRRRALLVANERVRHSIGRSLQGAAEPPPMERVDLRREFNEVGIGEVLDQLDRELIGLKPVKTRIREIASLLLIERIRKRMNLTSEVPTLHMSFTGNPGTGKTTVALRIASILHKLGFVRRGQVVSVTRDELVGQYIGHTAPKTKEILKKAMGGVLFIDEAYYLHRPDNERDYGQEAIEILLQVMESQREDLVVILAGYGDRMDKFFASNPGFRSRIAHHIDFPDYSDDELLAIAELMLQRHELQIRADAREAFVRYIALRKTQPLFSNARSIRNALDRMRLRQANRLVADLDRVLSPDDIMSLEASDVLASRVFSNRAAAGNIE